MANDLSYEGFLRVDLRVGTVRAAERLPKSDKMLKLEVSFGALGPRTILAGIGKYYEAIDVVGKQVVAVFNLVPRKIMDAESQGMLLATHAEDGKLVLACCPGAADGAKLG